MNEYTFEFPNMDATPTGKDGESISEEQTLLQETYENQGWLFEYGEEGFYRYHWEIDDGLPYIVFINEIEVFPSHDNTINGKDGQDASIFDLIEKETYEDAGWDFDTIWEMPEHDEDEGIFYLPNLQGLEITLMPEQLVELFAVVIYIAHKYSEQTLLFETMIITRPGTIILKAARLKGYEAKEEKKIITIDKLGQTLYVEFDYYIKQQYLTSEDGDLSLIIASVNKKRDRYKFRERLLSGDYVLQAIDTGRNIWDIRFYATEEQKRLLDTYFSVGETIEYIKNLKATKLKIKELNWDLFAGGSPSERVYLGEMEAVEVSS